MARTDDYYNAVRWHRDGLREIWATYNDRMVRLKPHKGSEYYDAEEKKAVEVRDRAIRKLKQETAARFDRILAGMRENAATQPMIAPTAEQLALLQMLQMREHLTRDELENAANSMKGCPVAMAALEELAKKHEVYSAKILSTGGESNTSVREHIDSLQYNASLVLKLEKPDSKSEMALSTLDPRWNVDEVKLFRIDFDAEDTRDAMERYGGVQDYDSFSAAVDDR